MLFSVLLLQAGRIKFALRIKAGTEFQPLIGLYRSIAVEVGGELPVAVDMTAGEVCLETTDQGAEGVFLLEGTGVGGVAVAV